jgi:hypothetical protein
MQLMVFRSGAVYTPAHAQFEAGLGCQALYLISVLCHVQLTQGYLLYVSSQILYPKVWQVLTTQTCSNVGILILLMLWRMLWLLVVSIGWCLRSCPLSVWLLLLRMLDWERMVLTRTLVANLNTLLTISSSNKPPCDISKE